MRKQNLNWNPFQKRIQTPLLLAHWLAFSTALAAVATDLVLDFPGPRAAAEILYTTPGSPPQPNSRPPRGRILAQGHVKIPSDLSQPQIYLKYDGLENIRAVARLAALKPWAFSASKLDFDDTHFAFLKDFTTLYRLNLNYTLVSDKSLPIIANMKDLHELKLTSTEITGSGFEHLNKLKKLEIIEFSGMALNPGALAALKQVLPGLQRLALDKTGLKKADCALLSNLTNIEELDLGGNRDIDNQCLRYLMTLKKLDKLVIYDTAINARALPALAKMPALVKVVIRKKDFWLNQTPLENYGKLRFVDHQNTAKVTPDVFTPLH
ncbi:MAG: hypothetical protein JSS83_01150 [Cyanobacteria bacterium SZAS LIN-3]|nr:hypothetical protein [Cyanobacteria bacterium SZAS LIN-3]MBS2009105.1 hypothetical protein [Cyanobacteria bacterium SZAS TMP-1]